MFIDFRNGDSLDLIADLKEKGVKIDILLTDMLVVYDPFAREDFSRILHDVTSGRVPKIKITGIGKPKGALTATYNGFTAI